VIIKIFPVSGFISKWKRFSFSEAFAPYQSWIFSTRKWTAAHGMIWYMYIEEEPPRLTQSATKGIGLHKLTIVALKIASLLRYLCRKSRRGTADRSATVAAKPTAAAGVIFGINL
jgi:hypothetical protein